MMRKVVVLLIVALLAAPVLAKTALKVGGECPDLSLPNLAGKSISLKDSLGKDVVILSFFASWSKSCQKEMNFLKELSKQYKKKNLKIIGVSFDRKLSKLNKYLNQTKLDFEILHDKKLKTLKEFKILIIPTLFVIDQKGKIKNIYVDFDKNVKAAVVKDIKTLLNPKKKK